MNKRLVRLKCGATGVDLGYGYGIYVSAQDNELSMDEIVTDPYADAPWRDTPIPSEDKILAARMVLGYFAYKGLIKRSSHTDEMISRVKHVL